MIKVSHINKYFGSNQVLDDVSFHIKQGEIVGFLGPNGAGKTTMIRIICGILNLTSGQVKVAGFDLFKDPLEIKRQIGYAQETANLYKELKVVSYLKYVAQLKDIPRKKIPQRLDYVIAACDLEQVLQKAIGAVSKGYRQRVSLAQALIADPPILIMDEPVSGLDPVQIVEIRNLIKSLVPEHTVFLSTHLLSEATLTCSRVIIISQGKIIAEDTIENITTKMQASQNLEIVSYAFNDDIISTIASIPGIINVTRINDYVINIKMDLESNAKQGLFSCIAQHRWNIEEIRKTKESLEDFFIKRTDTSTSKGAIH